MASRLNLVIAVQVVLGAALYGLGRASLLWPACLAGAAAASLRYTDRRRQFAVGPLATNTAILLIACITGWRYFNADGTADVEIVAEAVVCLQGVLLFERKSGRTRWDLFILSLVLVLLSSFLVQQPLFGFGLVVYFFVAFSTLALLYLEREAASRSWGDRRAAALGQPSKRRVMTVRDWWRLMGLSVATLLVGPLALFLRWEAHRADHDGHPSADGAAGPSTGVSTPVGRQGRNQSGAAAPGRNQREIASLDGITVVGGVLRNPPVPGPRRMAGRSSL
jgi:stage V sporulation protein SpoVS